MTIPIGSRGCLSSSSTPSPRLYITGGAGSLNEFQIIDLVDLELMTSHDSLPTLTNGRSNHGCIVASSSLWAIGGQFVDSVEAINITDITTESWRVIGNLSCELRQFGVTAIDDLIFIVGGYCSDTSSLSDVVYTINTVNHFISIYGETLPNATEGMPVLVISNTIYGFGGWSGSYLDSWTTLTLLCVPLFICKPDQTNLNTA